jgi:alpha-tubulin suppressor-like RCC1 family protein
MAGQLHACGLTAEGATFCWGAYASGQLGTGASADQPAPARAAVNLTLKLLALGGDVNTCGLDAAGAAYCWGNNSFGQLGNGVKSNAAQPQPVAVTGGSTFASLVLGRTFVCGLDASGNASCWGANDAGQIGDGSTAPERLTPTRVSGTARFASLSAGDAHACGLTTDGTAWCWGSDATGRLGDGTAGGTKSAPVAVTGGLKFTAISAGEEFTCAIAQDRATYCWGSNRSGWLGDGTDTQRLVPTRVKKPA